ncbi:MAG: SEC-C metal-binding domain-containing protein [Acidobacteriota bacterium]
MSRKPSRNDPCPCGSGNKYKKCCLLREEEAERQSRLANEAVGKAVHWLHTRLPEELSAAIDFDYCAALTDEEREELRELPEGLFEMFQLNSTEWVLAEGALGPDGPEHEPIPFMELILGEQGPELDASERHYLTLLATEPLDLYEAVDVKAGEGLWLRSTLAPKPKKTWVRERSGSRTLRKGDILAARLLPLHPPILSGAVYAFARPQYLELRGMISDLKRGEQGRVAPHSLSECVIAKWLQVLVGRPPRIVDASTGDSILLTNLHYRIVDWDRLVEALRGQPDVAREEEDAWVRFDDPAAEPKRIVCALRRKGRRLEVFARTAALADAAESWLSEIAGDALEKKAREVSDPRHLWRPQHRREHAATSSNDFTRSLSFEERSNLYRQIYRQMYAKWADEPIPMLHGSTPREAIRSEAGRREVVELLRSYEVGEREQARRDARAPFDFGFLWDELGLNRELTR